MLRRFACGCWVLVALSIRAAVAADAPAGGEGNDPTVKLFDSRVDLLKGGDRDLFAGRANWRMVPEDKLDHAFEGEMVLLNDRMAVIVGRKSGVVRVHSRVGDGFGLRAAVGLRLGDGSAAPIDGAVVRENSAAAVMVEVGYRGEKGNCRIGLRLTAGERMVELRPVTAVRGLHVRDDAELVVVPDFFADDLVFDPGTVETGRLGLPIDNVMLGLANRGETILAYVWRTGGQNATMNIGSESGGKRATGYEFDLVEGKSLWIAALEQKGVWHREDGKGNAGITELNWKPPFAAKWRVDWARPDGLALSRAVLDAMAVEGGMGACIAGSAVRVETRFAPGAPAGKIVAYPIDRSRATPLSSYTLVDVLRNAIGFGPCQYVLDAEGLGGADSPAPEPVTHWVEKQLEKKASRREPDVIRQRLNDMLEQVKRTDGRIAQYQKVGQTVREACTRPIEDPSKAQVDLAKAMVAICESFKAAGSEKSADVVGPLVQALTALAEKDNALEEARTITAKIRAIAGQQDYALARLRMAVRRSRVECRMTSEASKLVQEVQAAIASLSERK